MSENAAYKTNGRLKFSNRGVTLIEMMVAVLVLSIGLLGIAGLQAATSKYKVNTWVRASSATLVSDLSERIRVNPDAAGTGFATNGVDSDSEYIIKKNWDKDESDPLTISKNCEATACTASERASFDILTWRRRVRESLPIGQAVLMGNKKNGFTVTLLWFDKELVDSSGDRIEAPKCSDAGDDLGMAQQTCCPKWQDKEKKDSLTLDPGVRCLNFSFVP